MEQNLSGKVNEFLRRLEAYDFAGAQKMCTEKAIVWENDGEAQQVIDERLDQFRSFVATVDSMRYDVIRQFRNSDEVLQQQVLHLVKTDGSRSEIQAFVHFRFENGLIDRIEEYHYTASAGEAP